MSDALLDRIREVIQRDVNNRGLTRDPNENLFTACRDDFVNACRSIAEHPMPSIVIVTGFFIPHAQPPCGETDGPLGAIFLARAFSWLGIRVTLLTDLYCGRALKIGLEASGVTVSLDTLPKHGTSWTEFFDLAWRPICKRLGYSHLIALERVGPGSDGLCRNMHGNDITQQNRPAHLLFEDAPRQIPPLCSIGIGDGGNEIGMGKIPAEVIARNILHGERIACRVPTDHLIVAGVSNWGAYALAAGVAVLRRQRLPWFLFDVEYERERLRVMVEEGPLVDGVTARQTVTVDGLAFDDYAEPLRRIGELLEKEQWLS
jgi:D-glutamate cyclase